MKTLINVQPTGSGLVRLELHFGTQKDTYINLRPNMVPGTMLRTVVKKLQRYVNHREQILRFYGGHLTHEKGLALRRMKELMRTSDKWTLLGAARLIWRNKEDFYLLLPGTSSQFYDSALELLNDLLNWAEYEVTQHEKHYGHNHPH
jgi:hypothetical protein